MYVSRQLVETLGEGTSALCLGPPLSGKREFLVDLVERGVAAGHAGLFVTTDASAAELLSRYPDAFPTERTAIVDCSGSPADELDHAVENVGSPADLTGVAVGVSKALGDIGATDRPVVVVLDSLTTVSLYTDFARVFRFYHSFTQQVTGRGGVLAVSIDDDTLDRESIGQLQSVTESRVEFRNAAECRLVGSGDTAGEWTRMDERGTVEVDAGEATTTDPTPERSEPHSGSLAALIEAVRDDRPTLTLCNVPATLDPDPLLDHAARLAIPTRTVEFGDGHPEGVLLLHDGATLLGADPLADAVQSLADPFADDVAVPLLEAVPQDVFGADSAGRGRLLRASRTVERLAVDRGAGTIHAGFQAYSRLLGDPETVRVYERLLEEGVTVHLYGEPDADLEEVDVGAAVRHDLPADEVGESWFVVYDGDDDPGDGGALVTRQVGPDAYDGFWSYDAPVVERALEYLETSYGPT